MLLWDEEGNITFNPAKFALGFLGGAVGSKSIERLAKNPKARAVMERIIAKRSKNLLESASKTQETQTYKNLRQSLKAKLQSFADMDIINKQTGLSGRITNDEINKIMSSKAVNKSLDNGFSKEEHFLASENIKELFEEATLLESHKDIKGREHIKVHRFGAPLQINNKEANAKITLFEKIEGKNKIYTLELEALDKQ